MHRFIVPFLALILTAVHLVLPGPALAAPCTTTLPTTGAVAGGTYTFSPAGCTHTLTGELQITAGQSVTINGNGAIIEGDNTFRLFYVRNAGSSLTINNATLTQGNSTVYDGGAVYALDNAAITLDGVTITNSSADDGGAASAVNSSTLTVINSTFTGNSATNISGKDFGAGGALFGYFSTITVVNSTFTGNNAISGGGAIGNEGGSVTVNSSTFTGNSAGIGGGAFGVETGTLTVTNSTITGNTAGISGGAFATQGGTVTLSNNTISGNNAPTAQGFLSDGTTAADATNNYWGAADGPAPTGTGDGVLGLAPGAYTPFLAVVPGTPGTPGTPAGSISSVLPNCGFVDGRLNDADSSDCAQPAAIYCQGDDVLIYGVDGDSSGFLALVVTGETIAEAGVPADENLTLATSDDGRFILSRLTTGELQLNTWSYDPYGENNSKPYVVIWNGCPATSISTQTR